MNILVTGGMGFIGSNLVERLLSEDHSVTVIDDMSTGYYENMIEGVDYQVNDILSDDWNVPEELDVVFHLAGVSRIQPSLKNPERTTAVNIQGTSKICQIAVDRGAKLVYAGSCSFYEGEFLSPYSFSKWAGEEVCKMYRNIYNLPISIARFFNVYGNRQIEQGDFATVIGIFERQTRTGQPLTVTGTGEQKRDFVHVDDIVEGLILMSKDPKGKTYNLASGKSYSILEIAKMFRNVIQFIPAREGEDDVVVSDISESKKDLNYNPKGDIREYISGII